MIFKNKPSPFQSTTNYKVFTFLNMNAHKEKQTSE